MSTAEKLLLTVPETSKLLGLSPWKIWELIRMHQLDSVKIGGCRRVPRVAIDRYVERLTREAGAA